MWIAGCPPHSRIRSLGFIKDLRKRRNLKKKGTSFFRKMLSAVNGEETTETTQTRVVSDKLVVAPDLSTDTFCFDDMFYASCTATKDTDSSTKFCEKSFSTAQLQQLNAPGPNGEGRNSGMQVAHCWLTQEYVFTDLFKIAMRVYATPAPSSTNERNVSAVNRIITTDRSRLKAEIVEHLLHFQSSFWICLDRLGFTEEVDKGRGCSDGERNGSIF